MKIGSVLKCTVCGEAIFLFDFNDTVEQYCTCCNTIQVVPREEARDITDLRWENEAK